MNLLFLNLYSGRVERGAESFTHDLATRLEPHHKVIFLKGQSTRMPTSQFSGSIVSHLSKRIFLDKPAREVLFFTAKHLPHILRSNYQVIFPLNGFWQVLLLKLIQPIKRFKIIVIGNSGPGWDERFNLYLHPNWFVATTRPTLTWAQKTCPWTKSILIPYAINPQHWHSKPTNLNLCRPVILCPSALVPYKRVDLAIKAVAQLKQGSLLVLGKGPLKCQLIKLGKQLLGSRFKLTSTAHIHMPAYYQACDLVTLPSDPQENSPMVFLEALAVRKPIVTTDSPRNRWMLGHSAVYTDPANTLKYSQALQLALNCKPNASALRKFTWQKILSQYQKLLNSI